MAVVAIKPTQMTSGTAVNITANTGTAINAANTNTIVYPQDGTLLLKIESAHADTAVTIAASDFGVAAGQGAKTYAVGNGLSHLIPIGASSQFKQSGGYITLSYGANSAGFVTPIVIPTVTAQVV